MGSCHVHVLWASNQLSREFDVNTPVSLPQVPSLRRTGEVHWLLGHFAFWRQSQERAVSKENEYVCHSSPVACVRNRTYILLCFPLSPSGLANSRRRVSFESTCWLEKLTSKGGARPWPVGACDWLASWFRRGVVGSGNRQSRRETPNSEA